MKQDILELKEFEVNPSHKEFEFLKKYILSS